MAREGTARPGREGRSRTDPATRRDPTGGRPPSPGNPPLPGQPGGPPREVPPPPPPRPGGGAAGTATGAGGSGGARERAGEAGEAAGAGPGGAGRGAGAAARAADLAAAGAADLAGEAGPAEDDSTPPPPELHTAAGAATHRPRGDTRRRPIGIRPTTDLRPLRYRILPRTAIGISVAILCFAFGASLAGVSLYSYYEYRLTQNEDKVNALTSGIPTAVKNATAALKAQEADAQNLINQQIAPLKSVLATGQTVQQMIAKVAPSLYFVHTLDNAGQPAVGTAFAVASDSRQTLLLTSYTVVEAATRKPGPQLFVRHGGNDQTATVYTWDPANDLALIILPQGSLPTLTFASAAPQVGERVFAVSGLGAAGAAVTQGFVADVSANGIQHDATTGLQFQGGPLLNSDAQVVGILSRTYSPVGFPVADVWFAVPPSGACAKVLQCPNGTPVQSSGSGTQSH